MMRPAGTAHQIDVNMIVVIDVGARRQHGGELPAGGRLHVAQKALLFRHALPAVLHRNAPSVGERESGDIQRVAEGVFGNMRVGVAVHAAAGIGGDLLDLDDARAEPAHRGGLHGIREPTVEHRDDRTGQRRRGLYRHRPERSDRIALRRSEPRQRLLRCAWRCIGTLRIRHRTAIARRIGLRAGIRPLAGRLLPSRHAFRRKLDFALRRAPHRARSMKSDRPTPRRSRAGAWRCRDRTMRDRTMPAAAARSASAADCRCCRAAADRHRQNRSCRCLRRVPRP